MTPKYATLIQVQLGTLRQQVFLKEASSPFDSETYSEVIQMTDEQLSEEITHDH